MTNSHTVDELYIKVSSITKTVLILVASTNLYIFQHDPKGRVTLDLFCAYTTSFNIFLQQRFNRMPLLHVSIGRQITIKFHRHFHVLGSKMLLKCIQTFILIDTKTLYMSISYIHLSSSVTLYHVHLMTSSNGTIFRVTGRLCGEFTGHRWIPRTTASDAALWCFHWSAPE